MGGHCIDGQLEKNGQIDMHISVTSIPEHCLLC